MSQPVRRHERLYFTDGNVIFMTNDQILFRLFKSVLIERSSVLAGMFSLPRGSPDTSQTQGTELKGDGSSDINPVVLPQVNSAKFEALIDFFHPTYRGGHSRSTAVLMHLLEMSHFYDVQDAREYAMRKLNTRQDFTPLKRLWCARKFWAQEWVEEGITKLYRQPLEKIDCQEWMMFEKETVLMLWQGNQAIDTHRRICALSPPAVQHEDFCLLHEKCERAWRAMWWGTPDNLEGPSVLRALMHPDRIPIVEIIARLEKTESGEMRNGCRDQTVKFLARGPEDKGRFRREEAIIADIVKRFSNGE